MDELTANEITRFDRHQPQASAIAPEVIRREDDPFIRPSTRRKKADLPLRIYNAATGMPVESEQFGDTTLPVVGKIPQDFDELTKPIRDEICSLVAQGNFLLSACRQVGVAPALVKKWLTFGELRPGSIFEDFLLDLQAAEAYAEDQALQRIQEAGKDTKYWAAAAWFLERKYPERWGNNGRINVMVKKELEDFIRHLQDCLPKEIFRLIVEVGLASYAKAAVAAEPIAENALPEAT